MNNYKNNLDAFSLLTNIYDVESNILTIIKSKIQNFIFSFNRLFANNTWYNNHILKYVNYILSEKIYPIIITGLMLIKSKLSSFQLISEEYLSINILNKNKFLSFLLLNSFEQLIIKYIDKLFSVLYSFFFNPQNNPQKVNYYGKCIKNIFKHIKNLQNIIFGMMFYKSFFPQDKIIGFDKLENPVKLIGYGFIFKNAFNIYQNIKNIFNVYNIDEETKISDNNEKAQKNGEICQISNYKENNSDEDENICLLCLNKYEHVCCTPCGHLFCWSCIHLFLNEKNFCPKCKLVCKPQEILFLQNYLS